MSSIFGRSLTPLKPGKLYFQSALHCKEVVFNLYVRVASVMCSYNKINGQSFSSSSCLLCFVVFMNTVLGTL